MTQQQAAFIADALLALSDKAPERPFYTDHAMQRKLKAAKARDPLYAHMVQSRRDDPLLRSECREILAMAGLTERQRDVLAKKLDGWTFEEIGRAGGHTKQGAQSIFLQSIKKLSRAFRVYPYKGLSEVYRFEVRRGVGKGAFGTMHVPHHASRP